MKRYAWMLALVTIGSSLAPAVAFADEDSTPEPQDRGFVRPVETAAMTRPGTVETAAVTGPVTFGGITYIPGSDRISGFSGGAEGWVPLGTVDTSAVTGPVTF